MRRGLAMLSIDPRLYRRPTGRVNGQGTHWRGTKGGSAMESAAPLSRAVLVHDAAGMALALAAGREALPAGLTLPLLSAPGAAAWLSPHLFLAMVAEASRTGAPPCLPVLDCGMAAGHALAALRAGCPALVLSAACPAFPTLASAAAERGAQLWPEAPAALDTAGLRPGDPRALARLRDWLRG
jgi:hypothetical protein